MFLAKNILEEEEYSLHYYNLIDEVNIEDIKMISLIRIVPMAQKK